MYSVLYGDARFWTEKRRNGTPEEKEAAVHILQFLVNR